MKGLLSSFRLAGDPLDILANGIVIAKGEVVMIGERLVSALRRLLTLRNVSKTFNRRKFDTLKCFIKLCVK